MKQKSKVNLLIDLILICILFPVLFARGDVHHVLGQLFGILLIVHIILHGSQIFCLIRTWIPSIKIRIAFICVFCVVCIAFTVLSILHGDKDFDRENRERKSPISYNRSKE
ncbi:MAG: hypothetical protein PHD83_03185 [Caldisericia bacterium]|nr:hypothetical protein [Caldisericia bacterium]